MHAHKRLAAGLSATVLLTLFGTATALAQVITISQSPLMTSNAAAVKPNLNFVLDDSGSMDWDYVPDWLNYHSGNDWTITASLRDGNGLGTYCKSTGTNRAICCRGSTNQVAQCMDVSANNTTVSRRGEVPFTSSDFNGVYYNPAVTYSPPKKANGTQMPSFTTYTAVPVDGIYVASSPTTGVQNSYTMNLTTSYPDLEYCTDTNYTTCLRSDNYLLPGTFFGSNYTTAHMTTVSSANNASSTTAEFVSGTPAAPTIATRSLGPYYYMVIPGEYCTSKTLTSCTTTNVPTATYPYPAKLRWCNNSSLRSKTDVPEPTGSAAGDKCQALRTESYQYPRYPTLVTSAYAYATVAVTVAVAQNASFTISSIKAGATELLASSIICNNSSSTCNTGSSTAATRNRNVASAVQTAINANSSVTSFGADANGTTVTISAPAGTAYNGATLKVNNATSPSPAGVTFGSFNNNGVTTGASVPGSFKRFDIVSGQTYGSLWIDAAGTLYTSSGTGRSLVLDRSTRTDCAAAPTCTYAEEMTNFANWYAYYHTRMQMMKTALSRAFAGVPNNKYRIGLFTINSSAFGNTTITKSITGSSPNRYSSNKYLDIALWDDTQREYWFNTLFKANPSGGTPLREALSRSGRIYARMLKGANDPIEESCQQNFTMLSTDGYWNGNGGSRITGGTPSNPTTTSMNDQDGSLSAPYKDGNAVPDTLADTAYYYYSNDLRKSEWGNCTSGITGHDACTNDVPTKGADTNNGQHMVTFTIGLGVNGVMQYRENYMYPSGAGDPLDYDSISGGQAAASGACLWQGTGTCTWPTPGSDKQENIDDLWHAAVNGRGVYYSARDPAELSTGLSNALATVSAQLGSATAATTSSPNVSRNYNAALSTTYTTVEWSGDVFMQTIDLNTGLLSSSKVWSAQPLLDGVTESTRNVWMYTTDTSASHPSKLKPFAWGSGTASTGLYTSDASASCGPTNERACFASPYIDSLSQFCSAGTGCVTSAASRTSASGSNLVAFLRGNRTYEGDLSAGALYRTRAHVLGDIVNSEATYQQNSPFPWDEATNPGYKAFAQANYSRAGSVFVGANDGMVHSFNAASGVERWAYVPSMVLPNMYKLADTNYSHQYFVDATPVVGDANAGGWKTLLVGGLGGGGSGYYALDVTDPSAPKGMWEFKRRTSGCAASTSAAAGTYDDCDLGYSYGNPIITKYCTTWSGVTQWAPDGTTPLDGTCSAFTWAVIVTSGYNNVASGDGKGYLYVLEAATGMILKKIGTGVGSTATPSNLGRVNVWVNNGMQDNVATTAYAGDMLGNLWRFNLVTGSSSKLAALGSTRPITAKPAIGYVANTYRVVYVPTGRLLSNTAPYDDLNLASTQGFYAIWDKNDGTTTWSPPSGFVAAAVTCSSAGNSLGDCTGSESASVFNGTNGGWYFDFPGGGERGFTDPDVVFGVIVFSSGSPLGSACSPSGSGRIWALDMSSGGLVKGATKAAASVPYMPPRPVLVSIGGRIEIIEGTAGGTGASAIGSSSGLKFSTSTSGWGGACIGSNCPQVPRHTIWRILSN